MGRERVIVPVCLCWLGPLPRPPETHILRSQGAGPVTFWGGHFAIIHCGGSFFHGQLWPPPMDQWGGAGPGHPSTEQQPGWPLRNGTAWSATRGRRRCVPRAPEACDDVLQAVAAALAPGSFGRREGEARGEPSCRRHRPAEQRLDVAPWNTACPRSWSPSSTRTDGFIKPQQGHSPAAFLSPPPQPRPPPSQSHAFVSSSETSRG